MDARELRLRLVLANAFKEGDLHVGGTRDDRVREDARRALLATTVADVRRTRLVDDGVSEALDRGRVTTHDATLDALTIRDVNNILLEQRGAAWARAHRDALPSEAIAAVAKTMTSDELGSV